MASVGALTSIPTSGFSSPEGVRKPTWVFSICPADVVSFFIILLPNHAISPGLLCFVKLAVRAIEQFLRRNGTLAGRMGNPDADGDSYACRVHGKRIGGGQLADAFGQLSRFFQRRLRQQHDEL